MDKPMKPEGPQRESFPTFLEWSMARKEWLLHRHKSNRVMPFIKPFCDCVVPYPNMPNEIPPENL